MQKVSSHKMVEVLQLIFFIERDCMNKVCMIQYLDMQELIRLDHDYAYI